MTQDYRFFDGQSAAEHRVVLTLEDAHLVLNDGTGGARRAVWALADLRLVPRPGREGPPVLTSTRQQAARLTVDGAVLAGLGLMPPVLGNSRAERNRVIGWVAATAALVVGLYFGLPPLARFVLVPLIPDSVSVALGKGVEEQVVAAMQIMEKRSLDISRSSTRLCGTADTSPELAAMAGPLAAAARLDPPLVVSVYNVAVPNAFALPGNRVVLTRGLLERMRTSDQVAGVLAHEIAHLTARDPMTGLVSSLGWSAVIGVLFGQGLSVDLGQGLLTASYTRAVESRADAEGLRLLAEVGWRQTGLAEALARLDPKDEAKSAGYFSSHPPTAERQAALAGAGTGQAAPPSDYTRLQRLCG